MVIFRAKNGLFRLKNLSTPARALKNTFEPILSDLAWVLTVQEASKLQHRQPQQLKACNSFAAR